MNIFLTRLDVGKIRFLILYEAVGLLETSEHRYGRQLDVSVFDPVIERVLHCIHLISNETEILGHNSAYDKTFCRIQPLTVARVRAVNQNSAAAGLRSSMHLMRNSEPELPADRDSEESSSKGGRQSTIEPNLLSWSTI